MRCLGVTRKGKRCSFKAKKGSQFCKHHTLASPRPQYKNVQAGKAENLADMILTMPDELFNALVSLRSAHKKLKEMKF